ncbi:Ras GTPase activation domain containing protein [Acanthamoeba castellanii str. Neff]|uniref:Ras GTPase activation domain containing protein n=1 Tax=Acanthamoeba castellanii (strain ATCC 30010 / Neff) TaxID=1257118 RepID=L8HLD1_ACACF|nr:Ras GTPase activation domain containing protein [Acanthamoeba castellanii str. Neff]ELR25186.1 Ras GTPase activation domain containing protein [Acanthamoeba castellanii str. Neff]
MDPHRETNPAKVESNLSRLLCTAKQVVDHICCSLNSIPNILRRIFCFLGSEIKQRFPEEVNMVLSGFFFLRFLCPALVTPNFYGICKVSTGAEFGVKEEEDLLVPIPVPNTKVLGSNGLTNGTDSSWMYNSGNSTLNPKYHATDNNGLYQRHYATGKLFCSKPESGCDLRRRFA